MPSLRSVRLVAALVPVFLAAAARAEIELPEAPLPAPPAPKAAKDLPAPAAAVNDGFMDHAVFADRDHFHGRFVSFSAKDGVVWRRKDCAADFTFRPDGLDALVFKPAPPKAPGPGEVALAFNNGDMVSGKLVECTPAKTVVETAWGGRVECDTKALRALTPARSMPQILAGFGAVADWQFYNGGSQDGSINGGVLTINNSTGAQRALPLPPKFRLELEMDTRGSNGAQFILLASAPDGNRNQPRDGYCFYLPGRNNGNQGNAGLTNAHRQGFACAGADLHKISVFVDTEAKTITLVVNGKKAWTRTEAGAFPAGKTLAFPPSNTVRATKLAVFGNGVFTEGGAGKLPAADLAVFTNGDKVQGGLVGIREGKVSFKAEFAAVEAPLDRVDRLEFSAACNLSPKRAPGEVRVEVGENDRVTLQVEASKDGTLTGKSALLGACAIKQAAVRKIEFNLDAPFRAKAAEAEGEQQE